MIKDLRPIATMLVADQSFTAVNFRDAHGFLTLEVKSPAGDFQAVLDKSTESCRVWGVASVSQLVTNENELLAAFGVKKAKPSKKAADTPAEKTADESDKEDSDTPAEKPADEPAEKVACKPAKKQK